MRDNIYELAYYATRVRTGFLIPILMTCTSASRPELSLGSVQLFICVFYMHVNVAISTEHVYERIRYACQLSSRVSTQTRYYRTYAVSSINFMIVACKNVYLARG